jgi:hypothetical protein
MAFLKIDKTKIIRPCLPVLFLIVIFYSYYSLSFAKSFMNVVIKCIGCE